MVQFNEDLEKTVKGIASLSSSQVISRIIGAFGGLIVIRLLGPFQFGLASIALIIPTIIGNFGDLGVTVSMTKYIAEYRKSLEPHKVRLVIYSGIIFIMGIAFSLSLICYFVAELIAPVLFTSIEGIFLTKIACLQILACAVYDISWSIFLGFEQTHKNSIQVMTRTLVQPILSLVLVLRGYEALGLILGIIITGLATGSIGTLYIFFKIAPDEKRITAIEIIYTMKELVKFGLPLGVSASISDKVLNQYLLFIAAIYSSEITIGYFNAAIKLYSFVGYIITPISQVLLPAFSKVNQEKETEILRTLFKYSTKYSTFFITPISFFVVFNSALLTQVILGTSFLPAWWMLILIALKSIYIGFGEIPVWQLLAGQGKTTKIFKINLLKPIIAIPIGFILISEFGILGLLVIRLILPLFPLILALREVERGYNVTLPIQNTLKINGAAFICSSLASLILYFLMLSIYIQLIVVIILISVLFSIISVGLKIIKKREIEYLIQLFKEIQVICWLLKFLQKFARD